MDKPQTQLEARLFKGFSDESRLLILKIIFNSPKTVSKIVEESGLSQPNTSAHLACLVGCGLIRKEKKGREVFYEVVLKEVSNILHEARKILKKNSKKIYNCTHI